MKLSRIDQLVLGTAGLGGVWGRVDAEESIMTILSAMEEGLMAIDTAPAYGDAEQFVGSALAQWAATKPAISTKVGRMKSYQTDEARYDYSSDGMEMSIERSLKTLQIPIIDVLFLHDPAAIPSSALDRVVAQMQHFKQNGYTKKIGVGGNAPDGFERYLDAFDVIMEYNRLNACCIDALHSTLPVCIKNEKAYYAASPLNMGLLGGKFNEYTNSPPNWLDSKSIEQAKRVNSIAERLHISLDRLAHRFLLTIPFPFKMVIGAANRKQLSYTLDAIKVGALPPEIYNELLQTLN